MQSGPNVAVAFLSPSIVTTDFFIACSDLFLRRQDKIAGRIDVRCGGGITRGRNVAVKKFLETSDQWLLFVDSDMSFTLEDFDKVMDAADPVKRPVVGGLCFGQDGTIGPFASIFPTIFHKHDSGGYIPLWDYPQDDVVECDATGAAFLMIHRSVLERLAQINNDGDFSWFIEYVNDAKLWVSEDVAFCERVKQAGFPIYVATGAKILHHKGINYALSEPMYDVFKGSRRANA